MQQEQVQLIQQALLKLDVKNDDHWTGDGLPRVDKLGISGLKRGDVTAAAPQFTRDNFTLEIKSGDETQDPAKAETPQTPPNPPSEQDLETNLSDDLITDSPELAEAKAKFAKATEDLHAAEDAAHKAHKDLDEKRRVADGLAAKVEALTPKEQGTNNIRHYLETQKQIRAQRAEQHAQYLKSMGMKPVGSKLDQSMARQRGFGNQRPNMGLLNSGKV